jgi:signal transduction histidine kinase
MRASSLRLRLILGGALAIVAALAIAGTALTLLFERHVARTISDDLDLHLDQLVGGIDTDPAGDLVVTRPPADPRFAEPLSGLYWQVSLDDGRMVRSRSLWDTTLSVPADEPAPGEIHHHEATGPNGARMLVSERRLALTLGERRVPVRAMVAADLARVSAASLAFAKDLAVALAILGVVLSAATSLQVVLGLRPLAALRKGISDVRSGRRRRLPETVPREVTPLVEEVNGLLDAQEREINHSRGRAADLAHGLKTPLAALAADARRLRGRGEPSIARDIEAVAEAMSRQIDRELARARVRAGGRVTTGVTTELAPLARSLIATLARTPSGGRVVFEQRVPEGLQVPIDRTDLAEVIGNLMDNAAQHAAARVRIGGQAVPGGALIEIEDDGPGIAAAARSQALRRGVRLDERGTGAGLGLAIVQDILDAYGWRLALSISDLGGLRATVLPAHADTAPAEPALELATS